MEHGWPKNNPGFETAGCVSGQWRRQGLGYTAIYTRTSWCGWKPGIASYEAELALSSLSSDGSFPYLSAHFGRVRQDSLVCRSCLPPFCVRKPATGRASYRIFLKPEWNFLLSGCQCLPSLPAPESSSTAMPLFLIGRRAVTCQGVSCQAQQPQNNKYRVPTNINKSQHRLSSTTNNTTTTTRSTSNRCIST